MQVVVYLIKSNNTRLTKSFLIINPYFCSEVKVYNVKKCTESVKKKVLQIIKSLFSVHVCN